MIIHGQARVKCRPTGFFFVLNASMLAVSENAFSSSEIFHKEAKFANEKSFTYCKMNCSPVVTFLTLTKE